MARNPGTPSGDLARLADCDDEAVVAAVAENPNTPENTLLVLWRKHPERLLKNPILGLWEFSGTPGLSERIPVPVLLALYAHLLGKREFDTLERILPVDRRRALFHEAMSFEHGEDFDLFARDPSHCVRRVFADPEVYFHCDSREKVPVSIETAMRLARDESPSVVVALAKAVSRGGFSGNRFLNPETGWDSVCRILASHGVWNIDIHLSKARMLPPDLLDEFSKNGHEDIRVNLCALEQGELETHLRLAGDVSKNVRKALATSTRHAAAQAILSADPSIEVRKALAASRHLAESTMESLLAHPDWETRAAFAANPATPPDVLSRFSMTEHPGVLDSLIGNPGAPDALVGVIIQCCPRDVQLGLLRNAKRLTREFYLKYRSGLHPLLLAEIATRGGLGPDILNELANHADGSVRLGVAHRLRSGAFFHATTTNQKLLDRLIEDPDKSIRAVLVEDRRLSPEQRLGLFQDESPDVRVRILSLVMGWTLSYRNRLYLNSYNSVYRFYHDAVVALASDPCDFVRFELAGSREAPPSALGILFDDPDTEVRDAARSHTRFPFGAILDLEFLMRRQKRRISGLRGGRTVPSREALEILSKSRNPFLRHQTAMHHKTSLGTLRKLANDSHPFIRDTARARLRKT